MEFKTYESIRILVLFQSQLFIKQFYVITNKLLWIEIIAYAFLVFYISTWYQVSKL